MPRLSDMLHEMHRRSVWQVLGVYLAVSWLVIQVVETLTESAGLPDWVPPGAIVLLLIGLPIVLATAVVQKGVGGTTTVQPSPDSARAARSDRADAADSPPGPPSSDAPASGLGRVFTWRNAIVGGVAAFALLGVCVAGYFVLWSMGWGPVGSLVAQGVLDERDVVILADFENATADEGLADVVTEALRVDLDRSEVLSPLSSAAASRVLERMGRDGTEPLTADLAREAALREGIKAVIEGEIGAAGSGYVLTSRLVNPDGDVLASFRVTASGDDEVIEAIDELSRDMRERAGESLRAINAGEPLSAVTTPSLEALRLYSQATDRSSRGDRVSAVRLLEEALVLDPEFAMAYRKLGVDLGNLGQDPDRQVEALTRAYELRGRLTERERGLAEAYYFTNVIPDPPRATAAYERVLALYPDDPTALNNLAISYSDGGRRDEAIALLRRAIDGPGVTVTAYTNLLNYLWDARRDDEAEALLGPIEERYGGDVSAEASLQLAAIKRQWADVHEQARARIRNSSGDVTAELESLRFLALADAARGRLAEARQHSGEAIRIAREQNQDSWVWAGAAHQAWYELFIARSPGRARAVLEGALASNPYEGGYVNSWDLMNVLAYRSLAGSPGPASELRALAAASPQKDRFWVMADLYFNWAHALAKHDAPGALEAIDRLMDRLQCDRGRCWGHFERGLTLEGADRTADAIDAYELHMQGTAMSESTWDGISTAAALEQLCTLSAEIGDAERARKHCGALLELWSDADAELQPRLEVARERMNGPLPATVGP